MCLPDLLRETRSHPNRAFLSLWPPYSSTAGFVRGVGRLETCFIPCSVKQCFIHTWVCTLTVSAILSPLQLSAHTPNLRVCVCVCTEDQGCHYWIDGSLCLTRLCRFSTLCEQRQTTHTHIQLKILEFHHKVTAFSRGSRGTCVERPVLV